MLKASSNQYDSTISLSLRFKTASISLPPNFLYNFVAKIRSISICYKFFRQKVSNYFNIWLLRRYFGGLNLYGLSMITASCIRPRSRGASRRLRTANSASWKSCLLQGEQSPPLYPLMKGGMTRGCSPRGA